MCIWEERRLRGCSTIWENGLVGPAGHPRRAPPALPPDAPPGVPGASWPAPAVPWHVRPGPGPGPCLGRPPWAKPFPPRVGGEANWPHTFHGDFEVPPPLTSYPLKGVGGRFYVDHLLRILPQILNPRNRPFSRGDHTYKELLKPKNRQNYTRGPYFLYAKPTCTNKWLAKPIDLYESKETLKKYASPKHFYANQ